MPPTAINYNMQGYLIETDLPLEQDLSDITTGGSVGHKFYPGLAKASGSFKLMFDNATNGTVNVFSNALYWQQNVAENSFSCDYGPGGNAAGSPKYIFSFYVKSVSLPVKVADVITETVSWENHNGWTVSTY